MKKTASEIRAVLKCQELGLSAGQIATQTAIPKTTVQRLIFRGAELNLTFSTAKTMTDLALEEALALKRRTVLLYAEPDWEATYLQHARKTKPVELSVLWEAYTKDIPRGCKNRCACGSVAQLQLYHQIDGGLSERAGVTQAVSVGYTHFETGAKAPGRALRYATGLPRLRYNRTSIKPAS